MFGFVYLKDLITKHLTVMKEAHIDKDIPTFERYKGYVLRE
jgi:hypothetical protein